MLTIAILCRRRMNITREKTSLRVGVVGTGGSGKLSLVQRYVTGEWPEPVEKEEKKDDKDKEPRKFATTVDEEGCKANLELVCVPNNGSRCQDDGRLVRFGFLREHVRTSVLLAAYAGYPNASVTMRCRKSSFVRY